MRRRWLYVAALVLLPVTGSAAGQEGSGWPSSGQVLLNGANGTLKWLKGNDLSDFLVQDAAFQVMLKAGAWGPASIDFLAALGRRTRLEDARRELVVVSSAGDELGLRHVRLVQQYQGLPVWGTSLNVHWNAKAAVYLVEGDYIPTPKSLNLRPKLDGAAAICQVERLLLRPCGGCQPELGIWRGVGAGPKLAFRVRIVQGLDKAWTLIVDADSGIVLERRLAPR